MKIDRLIGILSILLQQEKVTAPYLAEKFEVTRRTISRDIENLCKAGIPIVTAQGKNGGISIMDGYRFDRTLLTSSDMQAILAGLRSLDSVSGTSRYQLLMDKLSVGNSEVLASNSHILIDLSSWYKSSLAPKIELIQSAIDAGKMISFTYYAPGGKSLRTIERYCLVFQWASWYVWGYCTARTDFRMFKLNRMVELTCLNQRFSPRTLPPFQADAETIWPRSIQAEVEFAPSMKWRLVEEYGPESFSVLPGGKLLFQAGFSDKENLFSWLLSFGDCAELTAPAGLRAEFFALLQKMLKFYDKT